MLHLTWKLMAHSDSADYKIGSKIKLSKLFIIKPQRNTSNFKDLLSKTHFKYFLLYSYGTNIWNIFI